MKFKLLRGIGKPLHAKLGITAPLANCGEGMTADLEPDAGEALEKAGMAKALEPRPKPPAPAVEPAKAETAKLETKAPEPPKPKFSKA